MKTYWQDKLTKWVAKEKKKGLLDIRLSLHPAKQADILSGKKVKVFPNKEQAAKAIYQALTAPTIPVPESVANNL